MSVDQEQPFRVDRTNAPEWRGRFPYNEIISLLDVNRPFNLAESTSQDLTVGELLDFAGLENIRDLKLGYGTSAGRSRFGGHREACKVPAEQVVTTQGTALGLFLLAFEVCRSGDEAVLVTPCFPPSRDCLLGAGINVREIKLSFENGYRLDLDQIEASLSSKTKLVSIASPQNPSGIKTPRADVEKLLVLMERRAPKRYSSSTKPIEKPPMATKLRPTALRASTPVLSLARRYRRRSVRRLADRLAHGGGRRPSGASDRRKDEHRHLRFGAR